MLRVLFSLHLLLYMATLATAQQNYSLAGRIDACYEAEYKGEVKNLIILELQSSGTGKAYFATANKAGFFRFQQLPSGTYQLKATILGFPDNDTTIIIDSNIKDILFCIDKVYQPANKDSVTYYRSKAIKDIEAGRFRIYEWTALSIAEDPFKKLNPKVKKKYGFEYEMMGCVRPMTRQEIVQIKLWEAYNEVIYEHLTKVHGPDWRKTLKHERNKTRNAQ
jgi:hypothetical protein